MNIVRRYARNMLLGFDQLCNTIIGGAPDETISARAGRLRKHPVWKQLSWALDHLQSDHTLKAIEHERDGSQQSKAYTDLYDAYRLEQAAKATAAKAAELATQTAQAASAAHEAVADAKVEVDEAVK